MKLLRYVLLLSTLALSGCIGTIIETTTDAAIAIVKIPFKVGGAVVDVVTGDDDFAEQDDKNVLKKNSQENDENYNLE